MNRPLAVVSIVASVLSLFACGDDDAAPAPAAGTSSSSGATSSSSSSSGAVGASNVTNLGSGGPLALGQGGHAVYSKAVPPVIAQLTLWKDGTETKIDTSGDLAFTQVAGTSACVTTSGHVAFTTFIGGIGFYDGEKVIDTTMKGVSLIGCADDDTVLANSGGGATGKSFTWKPGAAPVEFDKGVAFGIASDGTLVTGEGTVKGGTLTKFAATAGLGSIAGITNAGLVYGTTSNSKPGSLTVTSAAVDEYPLPPGETTGGAIFGNKNGDLLVSTAAGQHFQIFSTTTKAYRTPTADGWEFFTALGLNDNGSILAKGKQNGGSSMALIK